MFNKRGGTEAAKGDLQELKDIHARGGSMSRKAKAAVDALKEPGMPEPLRSARRANARPRAPVGPRAPIEPGFADAPIRRLAQHWRGYWPESTQFPAVACSYVARANARDPR